MGLIVILLVLASLGWLALRAMRSLWERTVGWPWWAVLVGCLTCGLASGVWLGGNFEYQPTPRLRILGCPLPVACFALEQRADGEECWTDFVSPVPLLLVIGNVMFFVIVSVYPVWAAHMLWRALRPFGIREAAN